MVNCILVCARIGLCHVVIKCYDMVMECLFDPVAIVSCGGLCLGSLCQVIWRFSGGDW